MRFYVGTHMPAWLERTSVPLFVSRRRLMARGRTILDRRRLTRATAPWVMDSGGFTELNMYGTWSITPDVYAREVERVAAEIGGLDWAAPMDYMCEPSVVAKTRLSVLEHQRLTIRNFRILRDQLGLLVVPVLQGWTLSEYHQHVAMYDAAGVDLGQEPVVAVGSVCRRGQDDEIVRILSALRGYGLRLHAFGVRSSALERASDCITSADSLAWSYDARAAAVKPDWPGCPENPTLAGCANCLHYALDWRDRQLARLDQQRLEMFA